MEKARLRYTILGLSDGLFLGIGLSLGVSFFHTYSLTFASILLVGITGALSNMFATYNAENFATGQQMLEYREALFLKEYKPNKITKGKAKKNIGYAFRSFLFTMIGSLIVLAPYATFYLNGQSGILPASIISLAISLIVLGFIGSYNEEELHEKIMAGLKTIGIGIAIAALSTLVGFILSIVL